MIFVLAGVNGAGKSSIGGSAIRAAGRDWYNPDETARILHQRFPERPLEDINAQVWNEGHQRLQSAIRAGTHFAFETTLGGHTITGTLLDAIAAGATVNMWYCGLDSVDLHIERVAARVERGGHDIPIELIRTRYRNSIRNLCRLTPGLHQIAVYDNSAPLDENGLPSLRQLLHMREKNVLALDSNMPEWAKPVAAVCLAQSRPTPGPTPGVGPSESPLSD